MPWRECPSSDSPTTTDTPTVETSEPYHLPALVGEQYVLSSVISETPDTVLYAATQKDMQRPVVFESLRPEVMDRPADVQNFLEKARAQAHMGGDRIAPVLELLYADGRWHLARMRLVGKPLDVLLSSGKRLSPEQMGVLLKLLCRLALRMELEGVSSMDFALSLVHLTESGFYFDNPAQAGSRAREESRKYLSGAASALMPLLDESFPRSDRMFSLLERMKQGEGWTVMSPLDWWEEATDLLLTLRDASRAS